MERSLKSFLAQVGNDWIGATFQGSSSRNGHAHSHGSKAAHRLSEWPETSGSRLQQSGLVSEYRFAWAALCYLVPQIRLFFGRQQP
jgi:hypothetical protein